MEFTKYFGATYQELVRHTIRIPAITNEQVHWEADVLLRAGQIRPQEGQGGCSWSLTTQRGQRLLLPPLLPSSAAPKFQQQLDLCFIPPLA